VELVDTQDLKSCVHKSVPVRVRGAAPEYTTPNRESQTYRPSFEEL
ncbi:uncharacterized protein METZ01_LOCUS12385, partial [marine metagenome]